MTKKILKVILSLGVISLGAILVWLMNQHFGRTAEMESYVIPFNVGFRISTVYGMIALFFLLVAVFGRGSLMQKLILGFFIGNAVMPESIAFHSCIYIAIKRNLFEEGTYVDFALMWKDIELFIKVIVILLMLGSYIYNEVFLPECDEEKNKLLVILSHIALFIGMGLFLLRGFTNLWYLWLVLVTSILSWAFTRVVEYIKLRIFSSYIRKCKGLLWGSDVEFEDEITQPHT